MFLKLWCVLDNVLGATDTKLDNKMRIPPFKKLGLLEEKEKL
jgi:hypothetical protein